MFFGGLVVNVQVKGFSFKYDSDFQKKLVEFEIACHKIGEKIENQKIVKELRVFRSPKLVFVDEDSKQDFQNYKKQLGELWFKFLYNAAGDGFLLGLLASTIENVLRVESKGSNLFLSTGLMVILQNQYLKKLSYYDQTSLKRKTGLFNWWRWCVAWTAAEVGFAGMDAIINRKCL